MYLIKAIDNLPAMHCSATAVGNQDPAGITFQRIYLPGTLNLSTVAFLFAKSINSTSYTTTLDLGEIITYTVGSQATFSINLGFYSKSQNTLSLFQSVTQTSNYTNTGETNTIFKWYTISPSSSFVLTPNEYWLGFNFASTGGGVSFPSAAFRYYGFSQNPNAPAFHVQYEGLPLRGALSTSTTATLPGSIATSSLIKERGNPFPYVVLSA